MEIIKTGTNIATVKISDLPKSTETAGRATLAIDEQTNASEALELTKVADATQTALDAAQTANQSSQTALGAADKANQAAQNADDAREEMAAVLAGKADLDSDKKYLLPTQLDPTTGYQTGMITGKGVFRTDDPDVIFKDRPHTTMLAFVIPNNLDAYQVVYNEGAGGANAYGFYVYVSANKTVAAVMRGTTLATKTLSSGAMCFVAMSYTPNGNCYVRINEITKALEEVEYKYEHKSSVINIGGQESGTNSKNSLPVLFCRSFDFAMTQEQITEAYNDRHPELWRVPDKWRYGEEGQRCALDLVPEGLTPYVWRDMSGLKHDLLYRSYDGGLGACELSYERYESEVAKAEKSVMYGSQTAVTIGGSKGYFKSDSPALVTPDQPSTLIVCFKMPQSGTAIIYDCNTTSSTVTAKGEYIYAQNRMCKITMRNFAATNNALPENTQLCMAAISYTPNGTLIRRINEKVIENEAPEYPNAYEPEHMRLGGWSSSYVDTRIISVRRFDFAMTKEQLEEAWNGGHPELWRVPDEFRAHEIVWPIDNVTESQNVFLGNNPSQITTTQDVPQENGFSGAFQRFAGANMAPSVYCNLWIYKYNRAPIRLTIEYRSTSDLYSDRTLTKLLLPANTGDAKTVTLDVIDGVYGGAICAKTTDDTFEIRTIKAEEIGCILDLNAHGLLPTVWRDTSGHGNDVPYYPMLASSPTECELSYENHGFKDKIFGTAAPTILPNFSGQEFVDTTNKVTYTAYGTNGAGDWK